MDIVREVRPKHKPNEFDRTPMTLRVIGLSTDEGRAYVVDVIREGAMWEQLPGSGASHVMEFSAPKELHVLLPAVRLSGVVVVFAAMLTVLGDLGVRGNIVTEYGLTHEEGADWDRRMRGLGSLISYEVIDCTTFPAWETMQ
jgi:hypothetical protein